jgi:putative FmdB family regulatory protein
VPRYDYRCHVCDSAFEVTRPMAQAADPAPCPSGHTDTVKLLSQVAVVGRAAPNTPAPSAAAVPSAGGCGCGGGCVCAC